MRRVINHKENIGKKFNRLTILDVKRKEYSKKYWSYCYVCQCDCGKIKDIRSDFVLNNITRSCGCLKKEIEHDNERVRQMGLSNRKHEEKCDYCEANNHYAKGLCKNCYMRKLRNGNLEIHKRGPKSDR